jgi:23S rRNA (guanine745-N1)-methyltransferase
VVLDAGCGEGYYLRVLRDILSSQSHEAALFGIDLSKPGIRTAARRDPQGSYAVANVFQMPILPNSVDLVLSHFSPTSLGDFERVIRPGGVARRRAGGQPPDDDALLLVDR